MKKVLILCIFLLFMISACSVTDAIKKEYNLLTGKKDRSNETDFDYETSKEERQKKVIESEISGEIQEYWREKGKQAGSNLTQYENYTEIGTYGTSTFKVPFVIKGITYIGDGFIIENGIFEIRDIPSQITDIIVKDENNKTVSDTYVINFTTAGQIEDFDPNKKYHFIPIGNFTDNYYLDQSVLSKSGTPRLRASLNSTNGTV